MVYIILVVWCEEEDVGDECFDLDQVCVSRLAVFDLRVFLCRFEERG